MTYNLMHTAGYVKKNDGYPAYGNLEEKWNNGDHWKFESELIEARRKTAQIRLCARLQLVLMAILPLD